MKIKYIKYLVFVLIFPSSILLANPPEPPYVYMDWVAFGADYSSMKDNDNYFTPNGRTPKLYPDAITFKQCSEGIDLVNRKNAIISMERFNSRLNREEDYDDIRVRHLKIRCMGHLGYDELCVARIDNGVKIDIDKHIKQFGSISSSEKLSIKVTALAMKEAHCPKIRVLLESEMFHYPGHEKDIAE